MKRQLNPPLFDTTEYSPLFAGIPIPVEEQPAPSPTDPSGPPSSWDWAGRLDEPVTHISLTGAYCGVQVCGISRRAALDHNDSFAHLPITGTPLTWPNLCPECRAIYREEQEAPR